MKRIAIGAACLALSSGCAGRVSATRPAASSASVARQACQAVDSSFALGAPVYRECAVDRHAKPRGTPPRMDFDPRPPIKDCYSAVISIVVDERGSPVPATARVIRTTDPEFGLVFLNSIATWRFAPAQKDGTPVKQVVEIGRVAMPRVVIVSGDRPMTPPPKPTC